MARAVRARGRPQVRFRLRVTVGDTVAIGPGKVSLLEAIDATGSLTSAAKELRMSYRRAWLLVDELNRHLAEPAVATAAGGARGGGSVLTATGRELLDAYRKIETRSARTSASEIERLLALLAR